MSLFYLASNVLKSNFNLLREPYKLTYVITYKCQLKCKMCNIWEKPLSKDLELSEIERFFTKSNRFSWVNFSGGEIFLRSDIVDIIGIIVKHLSRLYLLDFPTNGFDTNKIVQSVKTVLTQYQVPKLVVTVSLDGPMPVHDMLRNVPGSWQRAVATFDELRRLRGKNFDVFFGTTLQGANIDLFETMVGSVRDAIGNIDYNDFHINIVHHSPHYYGNDSPGDIVDKDAFILGLAMIMSKRKRRLWDPINFLERRYLALSKNYLLTGKRPIACQALSASLFMDPAGDIYPCIICNNKVANILEFDYDIYRLWNENKRKVLRRKISGGDCPHCWTPCEAYQSIMANPFCKREVLK